VSLPNAKTFPTIFFISKFRGNWFGNVAVIRLFKFFLLINFLKIHPLQYALDKFVHLSKNLNKVITIQASKFRLFSNLICIDLYRAWYQKDLVDWLTQNCYKKYSFDARTFNIGDEESFFDFFEVASWLCYSKLGWDCLTIITAIINADLCVHLQWMYAQKNVKF